MAKVYQGTPVSPGAALGRVKLLCRSRAALPQQPPADRAEEAERFRRCYAQAVEETRSLGRRAFKQMGAEEAGILDTQLAFLQDRESVEQPIERAITQEGLNMAQAIDKVLGEIAQSFRSLEDSYMRQRAGDAEDIRRRLLDCVLEDPDDRWDQLPPGTVVVVKELSPSDTVRLDLDHVCAIVTQKGGYSSHVGIITRSRGIPSVCGLKGIETLLREGQEVLVDGDEGTVTADLDEKERERFVQRRDWERELQARLEVFRYAQSRSADQVQGHIYANIGEQGQSALALQAGAEGVGLLRSEFLYLDCPALPGEQAQFRAYREALEGMEGRPVHIRTLDMGGDKELPSVPLDRERNPFLGCRAIRLCLRQPELFRTQLRALLRSASYGDLGILFPMISGLEELRQAKGQLELARRELEEEGTFVPPVRVGIMVEIPSAALMAHRLAKEVDFFSIGTNDLVQYTLACERGNPAVEHLYSPCHPAVLRLMNMTAQAARQAGIPCGICGEAAADPLLLPLFWGMGLREFSMAPRAIPRIRAVLAHLDTPHCQELARKALDCGEGEEVLALLRRDMGERMAGAEKG
ncbi:phosphoenolpyruvate--protein phosphotransferase [Flavonifractor sp. An100]|uniref:phosphoenolpyruvate--protein phosphotransferase n=1 Tax=Flavonifractor sp. An100 TaxID=1965538 RepID=UPI000B3882F3|nr:phosphoenolpyruvate--protein phosphotransferase [Flavonifractor sp. An100]OUQ79467.1 phosphoenolpyruvate--protein phosphotransferase [Flavonifractor sp. An100]